MQSASLKPSIRRVRCSECGRSIRNQPEFGPNVQCPRCLSFNRIQAAETAADRAPRNAGAARLVWTLALIAPLSAVVVVAAQRLGLYWIAIPLAIAVVIVAVPLAVYAAVLLVGAFADPFSPYKRYRIGLLVALLLLLMPLLFGALLVATIGALPSVLGG